MTSASATASGSRRKNYGKTYMGIERATFLIECQQAQRATCTTLLEAVKASKGRMAQR